MMRSVVVVGVLASLLHSQAAALRIVVLEGEGAVNIIQQKTAVRPLIEVRDRNNVPVAGATVTFTIGGGQPAVFAGGAQTLTVTTNAAGQAAGIGFTAIGNGVVQIQAQAAYQGQIATATISQTNVGTAAAAATVAGVAAGAAAGGGISGATIGIVGAAIAAGGAVVATQAARSNEDTTVTTTTRNNEPPAPVPITPIAISDRVLTGPFSSQVIVTTTTSSPGLTTTCTSTRAIAGTLKITLRGGDASGTLETDGTQNEVSFTQSQFCQALTGSAPFRAIGNVTGGPGAYTFTFESSGTSPTPNGGGTVTSTETITFTGAMSGGVIAGTLGWQHVSRGTNNVGGVSSIIAGNGSTSMAVTLRP